MSVSELSSKYFQASQLPHSLGGSYIPGSATQRTQSGSKPPLTPSRTQQQHHNGEAAASGVNTLVRAFRGGHVTSNASPTTSTGGGGTGGSGPGPARPPPPSPHAKLKPLPPTKTKSSPMPPPKSRSRENSNTSQPPVVLKKPSPHSSNPHSNGDVSQRGEGSKPKLPMLPRSGGAGKGTGSPSQQNKHPTGFSSKLGSPTRSVAIKGHSVDKSSEGAGAGGVASKIQQFQKKSMSEDWHGATNSSSGWGGHGGDERTRSGSAGSQSSPSPNHSKQGSPNKAPKKPLIPVKLLSSERDKEKEREKERERRGKEGASSDRQTRGSISAGVTKGERERVSPRVPPPHNPHSHTHSQQHVHDVSPYASLSVATTSANHSADVTDGAGGEYENVEIQPMSDATGGRGHQQAPPPHPTSYENVSIKPSPKAQRCHAHQRPHPHQQQSSTSKLVHRSSVGDNYENVEFSPLPLQSSQRHAPAPSIPAPVPHPSPSEEHVMDDDDTLFGKEGPPGMKREEVIYENFGPDDGNKPMTVDEMERHINKKDKKGLSAEYLRIKNEPLCGNYKACRSVM